MLGGTGLLMLAGSNCATVLEFGGLTAAGCALVAGLFKTVETPVTPVPVALCA
jgi:hypothetical protein